jgi:ABC-2 type transport system permease protein
VVSLTWHPTSPPRRGWRGSPATPRSGPLFDVSIGGLTAWKSGVTEFILVGLMSLLTVVRHTWAEEETGRLELVRVTVIGRHAPLTAALLVTALVGLDGSAGNRLAAAATELTAVI